MIKRKKHKQPITFTHYFHQPSSSPPDSYHLPKTQVTTLVNTKGPSQKKKGRSKKAQVLVAAVTKSVEHFIVKGEEIALENPEIKNEMLAAVEEVRKTGKMGNTLTMMTTTKI